MIEEYIRQAAVARGIDPDIAVRVAHSEGGLKDPVRRAGYVKNGYQEPSYGPFQLLVGGEGTGFPTGMGNDALRAGIDPRDPNQWQKGVDFALDHARDKGWGAWYGAKGQGITGKMGVGGVPAGGLPAPAQGPQQGFTPPGRALPQEAAPFASAPEAVASAAGAPKAASMAGLLGGLGEILASAGQAPKMQVPALNAVADRVSAGTGINTQDPLGLETGNPAQSAAPSPVPGATMQNGAPDPGQTSPTIANMLAGMEKLAPKPPAPNPPPASAQKTWADTQAEFMPQPGSLQSQAAPIGAQPHSDRFDKMTTAPVVPSPAKPTLYTDPTGGGYETNPNAQGPNTTTPAMNPGPIQPIPGQRTVPNGAIVPPNEGRFDKMNPFGPKATPQGVTMPHEGRFDKMTGDNGDGFLKLPDSGAAPTPTARPTKKPFDTMGFLTALGGVMGALGGGSPELDPPSLSGVSHKPEFSGLPVTKGLLGMLGLGQ